MRYPLTIIGLILLALMTWARFDPASLPAGMFLTNAPDVLTDITAGTTSIFLLYSVEDGVPTFLGRNRFTLLPDLTA